jgi:hypothetical protein
MATIPPTRQPNETPEPRTVQSAKFVRLALVEFTDEAGQPNTSIVLVGDNNIRLLDAKSMGVTKVSSQHIGNANEWLKNGIFGLLEKKK